MRKSLSCFFLLMLVAASLLSSALSIISVSGNGSIIVIDGDMSDWGGINPVYVDAVNDTYSWSSNMTLLSIGNTSEAGLEAYGAPFDEARDLKALYVVGDEETVYIRLDVVSLPHGDDMNWAYPSLNASSYEIFFDTDRVNGSGGADAPAAADTAWPIDMRWEMYLGWDGTVAWLQDYNWVTFDHSNAAANGKIAVAQNVTIGTFEFSIPKTDFNRFPGWNGVTLRIMVTSFKPGEAWGAWGNWVHAFDPQAPGTPGEQEPSGSDYADFIPGGTEALIDAEIAEGNWLDVDLSCGPSAKFVYSPISPSPNETVTFNASISQPGWNGTHEVRIVSYEWDFGDGTTGTGVTAYHNFTAEGSYTVTLNVTDILGLWDTKSETINVARHIQVELRDGVIYVNGTPFFIKGVNWSPSYGYPNESKPEGLELRDIEMFAEMGANTLRIYWPNLYLIEKIETWNEGHLNNPIYCIVEIYPKTSGGALPDLNDQAQVYDVVENPDNPFSLRSWVTLLKPYPHILMYMIYHEFTWSSWLANWVYTFGPQKVNDFMNLMARKCKEYDPDRLVTHGADPHDVTALIHDNVGNFFSDFDILGFDIYPHVGDIKNRTQTAIGFLRLTDNRSYYIAETGASTATFGWYNSQPIDQTQSAATIELEYRMFTNNQKCQGVVIFESNDEHWKAPDGSTEMQWGLTDLWHSPKVSYYTAYQFFNDQPTMERRYEGDKASIEVSVTSSGDNYFVNVSATNLLDNPQILRVEAYGFNNGAKTYVRINRNDYNINSGENQQRHLNLSKLQYNGDYVISVQIYAELYDPPKYNYGSIGNLTAAVLAFSQENPENPSQIRIPGDANGDSHVDIYDLYILAKSWGRKFGNPRYDPRADFDNDGRVWVRDLYILAKNWYRW